MTRSFFILVTFFATSTSGSIVTARGKPTSASSPLSGYPPEEAVDGDTNSRAPHLFVGGHGTSSSWWRVDLGQTVISPTVTIYYRTDYRGRSDGDRISLSLVEDSYSDYCERVIDLGDLGRIPDIYNFTCDDIGRYLTISTETANDDSGAVLEFGEVEVYACSLYTFGPGCSSECHCAEESCNWSLETPTCPAGCLPGWKSAVCDTLVSASEVSVYMKPANTCDVTFNFNFEPVALKSVLEMDNLDLESRMECSHNCAALVVCVSFEYTASTCTLWRAEERTLSGTNDNNEK